MGKKRILRRRIIRAILAFILCVAVCGATAAVSLHLSPAVAVRPPTPAAHPSPSCLASLPLGMPEPSKISRYIHQSWKTTELPEWSLEMSRSWSRFHDGAQWHLKLHTDEDNFALVKCVFPWAEAAYDEAESIVRADLSRAAYMFAYGGVYADLDVEALRPFDDLLANFDQRGDTVLLGRVDPPAQDHRGAIGNAIMVSTRPGHPFWEFCMRDWCRSIRQHGNSLKHVEAHAGPVGLRRCLRRWVEANGGGDSAQAVLTETPAPGIRILPPRYFNPRSWRRAPPYCTGPTLDPPRCKAATNVTDAYAIAYWRHSWSHAPAS